MLTLLYAALVCMLLFVYIWSLYNVPILVAGLKSLLRNRRKPRRTSGEKVLPSFSIVVAAKNEEKVIGRLLSALSKLDYPEDKKEVVIVEDGSTDRTLDICNRFAQETRIRIRILHKPFSNGKPSALNYGIMHAEGDIIGVFDADNVPANDALLNVCRYFEDDNVGAVQGRTLSINSGENMLTEFISYEETVWCEAYLRGKDSLNLFVHMKGSCQFIRHSVLDRLKGFDEQALSEDMELSARLAENDYKIRYASDVRSWQESPSGLKQLLKQRTRWFRGTMEVAFRYGQLMAKPTRMSLDAEATLFGPFVLIASLASYFAAFYMAFVSSPLDFLVQFVMQFTTVIATLMLFACGLALIYASRPRKAKDVLWLPFVYFYWSLQAFIALYAVLLILLRRPRKWARTDKKGVVTGTNITSEAF